MALTKSDQANLTDAQRILIEQARFTNEFVAVAKNLVQNIPLPKGHKSVVVPKFGTVTANALAEGVDLANPQTITGTTTTITTSEVGAKVIITLKLVRQMVPDMFQAAGRILGNAMGKKLDQDIIANFDNFSVSTPGAGSVLTLADILGSRSYIETGGTTNEPPPDMKFLHGLLHPEQIADIVAEIAKTASTLLWPSGYSQDLLQDYFRGGDPLYRMPIFVDGNIIRDSGDDAKGAIFHKNAIIYVSAQDFETFREFDASLRAWELVTVADYSSAEYKDEWGTEIMSDAAARVS